MVFCVFINHLLHFALQKLTSNVIIEEEEEEEKKTKYDSLKTDQTSSLKLIINETTRLTS